MNSVKTFATSDQNYPLLVIVGPTAAGKSALALSLAEQWRGEIINYDAMQLYRGFNIGTGKLTAEEQRGVPHHLLDCVEPERLFTAGDFARDASLALASVRERNRLPILVGGTGLYLRALLVGLFEGPERSEPLRARLRTMAERRGRDFLHRLLLRLDAPTAARIPAGDTQKIMRAIEVCVIARQPFSSLLDRGRTGLQGFRAIKIGLNPDRAEHDRRINTRVERMFAAGLAEEAAALFEGKNISALEWQGPFGALGYPQAMAFLRGEISQDEAIRLTQTGTRRYAKRQRTWFRREPDVTWFAGFGDDSAVQRQVCEWLVGINLKPALGAMGTVFSGSARPATASEGR